MEITKTDMEVAEERIRDLRRLMGDVEAPMSYLTIAEALTFTQDLMQRLENKLHQKGAYYDSRQAAKVAQSIGHAMIALDAKHNEEVRDVLGYSHE